MSRPFDAEKGATRKVEFDEIKNLFNEINQSRSR